MHGPMYGRRAIGQREIDVCALLEQRNRRGRVAVLHGERQAGFSGGS